MTSAIRSLLAAAIDLAPNADTQKGIVEVVVTMAYYNESETYRAKTLAQTILDGMQGTWPTPTNLVLNNKS